MFHNRERAKQLLCFEGLQWGSCRPTDVDLSMDFAGRTFVMGELKGNKMPLTPGQRYHLEGMVKAIRAGGKVAYAFLAHHDTPDCEHDVKVAQAKVAKVFNGEKWFTPEQETVLELLDTVKKEHDGA